MMNAPLAVLIFQKIIVFFLEIWQKDVVLELLGLEDCKDVTDTFMLVLGADILGLCDALLDDIC